MNPLALFFALIMVVLILALPRKWAFIPVILTAVFMTLEQRVVIASLDFTIIRIVIIFGLIRVIGRTEIKLFKRNRIDNAVIWWLFFSALSYILLFQTVGATVNRLGYVLDALGCYLIFRSLILDLEDLKNVILVFALVSVIMAFFMLIERINGKNIFSIFGGVPEYTILRDGKLRCQGAFAHALNAGAFGASLMPLILSLLSFGSRYKKIVILSFPAATIITLLSSSSAPAMGYLSAVAALCIWPYRQHVRKYLAIGAIIIVFLQVAMKAPIWALVGRAKIFGASTGYHRYKLIDNFISHFDEWWLLGAKSTDHWGYGMWDLTNTYIHIGVKGGLLTLLLFILVLIRCFKTIGTAIRTVDNKNSQWFFWAVGTAMFANAVMFMGMSYFDQIKFIFYIHIAMISTIQSLLYNSIESDENSLEIR